MELQSKYVPDTTRRALAGDLDLVDLRILGERFDVHNSDEHFPVSSLTFLVTHSNYRGS